MNDNYFDSVDERCRSRFETDWLGNQATSLQDYLPDERDPLYTGTLHELVHIEMEFRWKRFSSSDQQGLSESRDRPESVGQYLKRFPVLNQSALLLDLIQAEFELRWQYQDQPAIPEYLLEFGKGPDGKMDVAVTLEKLAIRMATTQSHSRRDDPTSGSKLGRYTLVAEHGRGGFSAVWRADDTKMGRRIALKRLGSNLARQSETRRRFVSEARVTARLEHPGIVPVYDMSSLDEEHAYYTMKLVRGDTMAEKIRSIHELPANDSQRTVEETSLLRSFLDVCNAIDYCHARGVIHRDLKPQNIVVGNFGETIVLDWGLASVSVLETPAVKELWDDEQILSPEESVETLQGSVAGTPGYMPPEQAGSEFNQVGVHSDIYSLGAMLYHMITGQTAFQGGRAVSDVLDDIRQGNFPRPRIVNPSSPKALEAICLKAMQCRPADRYESVKQLSHDVEHYMADEPTSVFREPATVRFRRWIKKNQTVATGLAVAVVFSIVAAVAGWVVYTDALEREEKRIAEIREASALAENAGMLQLSENQWASALEFFEQCVNLVADEPKLIEISDRVIPKAEKLRSIVEAYQYADRAQQYLFDDHLSKAATYAQAAVLRTGVLEHDDWWNHVAVDGMNPKQVQYLQDEIYRLLGMWAAMRFAETTPSSFSFDWFLGLASGKKPDPKTEASCKSAKFATVIGQRYRPSTLMRLIKYGANLLLKEKDKFPFPVTGAENYSDAAMLGSILDNNISDNKMVMRILIADKDPEAAADAMLLDGLANIPDWYWLAIFVGENLQKEGRYQESIRTFSHAVGINPDGWMAYSRRANAYIRGSLDTESETEKNTYLKNALLDIKRAEALAPYEPSVLFDKGIVYSFVDGIEGVSDAFLHFAFNTPFIADTASQHRVVVVKSLKFAEMLRMEKHADDSEFRSYQAARMGAAALLWIGENEKAKGKIQEALEYNKDDITSQMLKAVIDLHIDSQDEAALSALAKSIEDGANVWMACQELGEALEALGKRQRACDAFEQAVRLAQVPWQTAVSEIAISRCALYDGDSVTSVTHFNLAVTADLSVEFSSVEDLLISSPDEKLKQAIDAHHSMIDPYFDTRQQSSVIRKPALKNGNFELELSTGWGESKRNSPRIWERTNGFWTIGNRETSDQRNGNACFKVKSMRPFVDDETMSLMTQQFPVTPDQRYRVSVWCRAEGSQNRTLGIFSDESATEQVVSIPGGTYDWQEFRGEFTAGKESTVLVIACKDQGTVWIDDISIEAVEDQD